MGAVVAEVRMQETKTLTVAYGSFACIVEGFDDPFPLMQETVAYFESLSRMDPEFAHHADLGDFETLRERFAAEGKAIELVAIPGGLRIRNVTAEAEEAEDGAVVLAPDLEQDEPVSEFVDEADAFAALTDGDIDMTPGAEPDDMAPVSDPEPEREVDVDSDEALDMLRSAMARMPMADGSDDLDDALSEEAAVAPDAFDDDIEDADAGDHGPEMTDDDRPAAMPEPEEVQAETEEHPEPVEMGQADAPGTAEAAEDEPDADPEPVRAEEASSEEEAPDAHAAEPEPEDAARAEPSPAEPVRSEAASAPSVAEPSDAEEPSPERSMAEPSMAEPSAAEPSVAESEAAEAAEAAPSPAEPSPAAPSQAEVAASGAEGDGDEDTDAPEEEDDQHHDADTLVFAKAKPSAPAPLPLSSAQRVSDASPASGPSGNVLRLGPSGVEDSADGHTDRPSFIDSRNSNEENQKRDTPFGSGHKPLVLGSKPSTAEAQKSGGGFLKILKGAPSRSDAAPSEPEPPKTLEFSDSAAPDEEAPKSGFGLGKLKLGWGRKAASRPSDSEAVEPPADVAPPPKPALEEARTPPLRVVGKDTASAPSAPSAPPPAPSRPSGSEGSGDLADRLHASYSGAEEAPKSDSFSIGEDDLEGEDERSARRFAYTVGAETLPDLMKACAAYLIYAEGKEAFTRGELLTVVQSAAGANAFSAEARIRAFGKLVRGGDLTRIEGGAFVLSAKVIEDYRDHLQEIAV